MTERDKFEAIFGPRPKSSEFAEEDEDVRNWESSWEGWQAALASREPVMGELFVAAHECKSEGFVVAIRMPHGMHPLTDGFKTESEARAYLAKCHQPSAEADRSAGVVEMGRAAVMELEGMASESVMSEIYRIRDRLLKRIENQHDAALGTQTEEAPHWTWPGRYHSGTKVQKEGDLVCCECDRKRIPISHCACCNVKGKKG